MASRDSFAMNWAGLYVGGHVGASAGKLTFGDEYGEFTQVLAGGHIGYNYNLQSGFVIGVEGDLNAKFGHGFGYDDLLRLTSSWDGSIRGRFGYAVTPRGLIYATGGWAFGRFSTPQNGAQEPNDPPEEHIGHSRTGWTSGGGIQYALSNAWSTRIEYRHTDWGTKVPDNPFDLKPSTLKDDRVEVGMSYKFGGPIVTRY